MPTELLVIAAIVIGAIALGTIALGRSTSTDQAHRRGPLARFGAILDASIGLFMLRRALGRPTATRADRAAARLQAETEAQEEQAIADAYAARLAAAAGDRPPTTQPTRLVVAGTASEHPRPEDRGRQAHPTSAVVAGPVALGRTRLWRDSAVAMAVLAIAVIGVITLLPSAEGDVLPATGTPGPSQDVVAQPTATASPTELATESPTTEPTDPPSATPTETAVATPEPTPEATPRPTRRPTPRPTAKPTPKPTAKPTPSATTPPTATPTPTEAPTPTPDPTVTPTPVPAPVAFIDCAPSGLTVSCDGSGSTDAESWSWDFGDGATDSGAAVSHTYAGPGDYVITLTVTNASGSGTDSVTIPVGG